MTKLALNYNHQRQPFAHSYPDPSGQLLRADTLKALVAAVKDFREKNGMEIGDYEQDVAQHYLVAFPWLVEESRRPEIGPPEAQDSPEAHVLRWINDLWRTPPKQLLTLPETQIRAEICRECNFHEACNLSTNRELARKIYLLARGEVPHGIEFCVAHRWHAGMACRLPDAAKRTRLAAAPEECWVRTE